MTNSEQKTLVNYTPYTFNAKKLVSAIKTISRDFTNVVFFNVLSDSLLNSEVYVVGSCYKKEYDDDLFISSVYKLTTNGPYCMKDVIESSSEEKGISRNIKMNVSVFKSLLNKKYENEDIIEMKIDNDLDEIDPDSYSPLVELSWKTNKVQFKQNLICEYSSTDFILKEINNENIDRYETLEIDLTKKDFTKICDHIMILPKSKYKANTMQRCVGFNYDDGKLSFMNTNGYCLYHNNINAQCKLKPNQNSKSFNFGLYSDVLKSISKLSKRNENINIKCFFGDSMDDCYAKITYMEHTFYCSLHNYDFERFIKVTDGYQKFVESKDVYKFRFPTKAVLNTLQEMKTTLSMKKVKSEYLSNTFIFEFREDKIVPHEDYCLIFASNINGTMLDYIKFTHDTHDDTKVEVKMNVKNKNKKHAIFLNSDFLIHRLKTIDTEFFDLGVPQDPYSNVYIDSQTENSNYVMAMTIER